MSKRVAAYVRVSDDDQNHELQVDELRAYVARRGWTTVGEYIDHGEKSWKERRPKLDEMMARFRRGGVDVVLVWKFSRFARSVRHLVTALDAFRALSVDFVSVTEGIDTTTPVGRLTFHVIGAIDQFFLDTLRENTRAGVAAARRRGKRIGRPRAERRHADQKGIRLDLDAARALIAGGASRREAARRLGFSEATLRRALARASTAVVGE